ncbi:MAG: hypothetical protein ACREBG_20955 [Pyrinomonadaceae bacterium]
MEYQIAYDIQQVAYPGWWIFGAGLFFIAAGTAALLLRDNPTYNSIFDTTGLQRTLMPVFSIGFWAVMDWCWSIELLELCELAKCRAQ